MSSFANVSLLHVGLGKEKGIMYSNEWSACHVGQSSLMQSARLMAKNVMAVWDKAFTCTHNTSLFKLCLLSKSTFLLSCVLFCRLVYYFAELSAILLSCVECMLLVPCEWFDPYSPKHAKEHIYSFKEIKCILIVVLWLLWMLKFLVAKLPHDWLLVNVNY